MALRDLCCPANRLPFPHSQTRTESPQCATQNIRVPSVMLISFVSASSSL